MAKGAALSTDAAPDYVSLHPGYMEIHGWNMSGTETSP